MILVWYVSGQLYNRRSFLYSIIANAPDSLRSIELDEELPKWIEKRSKQEDLLVEPTQLNMP